MSETGRAKIFHEGFRVVRPREWGEKRGWFGPEMIIAVFLEETQADAFVATQRAAGVPARVKERRDS